MGSNPENLLSWADVDIGDHLYNGALINRRRSGSKL